MSERIYPHGVPCWVDVTTADVDGARSFYGGLFGWEFTEAMPPGAPESYLIATLGGHDAAAIATADRASGWMSYIACDDAEATAEAVRTHGGRLLSPVEDAGPGGRTATCADPAGAVFRLWQARARAGAQAVNQVGAWSFSDLHARNLDDDLRLYADVFGWVHDPERGAGMVRLPGYGDHLAATVDPDIFERQAFAPEGFADVVAGAAREPGPARWTVRFVVADRDASAADVERLGGRIESSSDAQYTREAVALDPEGAAFGISQVVIPDDVR
jgi:uncharacterized protein